LRQFKQQEKDQITHYLIALIFQPRKIVIYTIILFKKITLAFQDISFIDCFVNYYKKEADCPEDRIEIPFTKSVL